MSFLEIDIGSEFLDGYNPGQPVPDTEGSKPIPLGQKAIKSSIKVYVCGWKGKGGRASFDEYKDEIVEEDGTETTEIISINYKIFCNDRVSVNLLVYYYYYVPSSITVRIEWKTYRQPPDEDYLTDATPDDLANLMITREEMIDAFIVRREGLNVKCIDLSDKWKRGNTEVRGNENIINPMIKDLDTAKRIGEYAIGETNKNFRCTFPFVPYFLMEPGSFAEIEIPQWSLTQIARVESISIKNSKEQGPTFEFSVKIRKDPVT